MGISLSALAIVLSGLAFVISAVLTGLLRRYSLSRALLDIPNDRSLHDAPTPRGGGLSFVAVFLAVLAGLALAGVIPVRLALTLGPGGVLVALTGWLDDRGHVPVLIRLAAQFLAAALALAALGGVESLDLGWHKVSFGAAGSFLAAVGIVWTINLYNFMDGIDGIAGVEAITTAAFAGLLLCWKGAPGMALLCAVLASAAAGFLLWNWPPAKIFMGDVGSGFLGYVFAVMALVSEKAGVVPMLAWVVLLGVFVLDTTVTLFRRLRRGETIWQAHRSHYFQRAVQAGCSHRTVTLWTGFLNVALGILAAAAVARPGLLLPAVAAAILLLGITGQQVVRLEKQRTDEAPVKK